MKTMSKSERIMPITEDLDKHEYITKFIFILVDIYWMDCGQKVSIDGRELGVVWRQGVLKIAVISGLHNFETQPTKYVFQNGFDGIYISYFSSII